ncbi:MAG: SDR family NAD(P)-dependent oxidoreductase [Gemmatimonadetes bacterium]|nr:SDR family NAD(P)-dependent oxidoreductase [Gemmatimonadota bacterium]
MRPLDGKVAVVAGATRGAGRGIACMLGEAGATVYCTGRSVRGQPATEGRPETIEETAEMVTAHGGSGIWMQVDHTVEKQVQGLFARVDEEQGRLDVLVNDVWGGDALTEWGKPFWKLSVDAGTVMLERAVISHVITSRHGVPLMLEREAGLIVEITDGDFLGYRGNLFYDLCKISAIRLAYAMAADLRDHPGIIALALTPGFLRSEAMLDHFGVTEANWEDAVEKDRHFAESETPFFVGRAVAALAADPDVHGRNGRVFASWTLAKEYGFRDIDGRQPDFGGYFQRETAGILDRGGPADAHERFELLMRYYQVHLDPARAAETAGIAAALGGG